MTRLYVALHYTTYQYFLERVVFKVWRGKQRASLKDISGVILMLLPALGWVTLGSVGLG